MPDEPAVLRFGIDDRVVRGIDSRLKAIAGLYFVPVGVCDPDAVARRARTAPRAIVLNTAVDEIRLPHVDVDGIELADRNLIHEIPRLAGVVGHVDAAIVPVEYVPGVLRINP